MDEPLSELAFDRAGMERATNLVTEWGYETVNGQLRRRLFVQDPDCAQDSGYCPCGPVGDWEEVPTDEETGPHSEE